MEYMQNKFPRFSPASVTKEGSKFVKKPRIKGWLDVTEEQSAALAKLPGYKDGHYMFLTGKANNIIVIDIDRFNPDRDDHIGKIDGLKKWDELFPNIDYTNSLIVVTPSGGRHIYCEYDETITSKEIAKDVLIDILSDNSAVTFGPLYQILQRPEINEVPPVYPEVKMYLTNNILNMGTMNQQNIQHPHYSLGHRVSNPSTDYMMPHIGNSMSQQINDILGTEGFTWKVERQGKNSYKLIPNATYCCIEPAHNHSEECHSCYFVHKSSVVSSCFSHGKEVIEGVLSRSIRDLFFDIHTEGKSIMVKIVHEICNIAKNRNIVRENGCVLKRIGTTHSYEYLEQYRDFLRLSLKDNTALKEQPRRFNDLMIYMNNIDSIDFPFIKRNKHYIGFRNGLLDIINGELVAYNILEHGVIPRHYIDQCCDFEDVETPLLDKILMYQLESDEIYTYMMAFIGRLFYDVRQFDSFDIIPFIIGTSNTGKSTIIDIICAMFSSNSVGVLDSSHEMVFGLQSKYNKELIVSPEITDRMAQQLASDMFKKIVCGELVNLPN